MFFSPLYIFLKHLKIFIRDIISVVKLSKPGWYWWCSFNKSFSLSYNFEIKT